MGRARRLHLASGRPHNRRMTPPTPRRIGIGLLALTLLAPAITLAGGGPDGQPLAAPPGPGHQPARELQLAAGPEGELVLAVIADSGPADSGRGTFTARELTAWRWAAGQWQALGGVLNYDQPRPLSTLNLALDQRGAPVLAWNENYGDVDKVVFRAYRDGAWTDWTGRYLGEDLPYAARTRAVAARDGEPVLAWGESLRKPDGSQLTVRRWDPAARIWTRSPRFNDFSAYSRTPALGLTAAGQPIVAWIQGEVLSSTLHAARWTGRQWTALGGPLNRRPATYLAQTRLVLDRHDQPTVAWLEDRGGQDTLYAAHWSGRAWAPLGGPLNTRFASAPALASDPQDRPVLAWVEERGSLGQVRLARWTGRAWQHFGALNRDARRDARSPTVAVDAQGRIVVAWREDVGGVYRVQLRRFAP